ncbi:MAG: DUF1116 domain-containing protein [Streptosporangiaceae bacterium]
MTTETSSDTPLGLPETVDVVNVGLSLFAEALEAQGAHVASVDWRIPGGGDPEVVAALCRVYGPYAERVDAANAEVVRRFDEGVPKLVGMRTVRDVAPGLPPRVLLHCGPPIAYEAVCDPLRRSMRAAVMAESWASTSEAAQALLQRGDVALAPANDYRMVLPMATALGPTQPVYVIENAEGDTTAFAPISQGPGEVPWFGMETSAAVARLEFLRDVVGPVLADVLRRSGPVDVMGLAAQGVAMGDDIHVRTQASTNLLIRHWLPHLAAVDTPRRVDVARFLADNHLFFLTLAMGAARALSEWAASVEGASVVTNMARNGRTFGIRLPGRTGWYLADAPEVGNALYYPGQGPETSAPDIGDSAILELTGLGGSAAAGSPSVAQFAGGTMRDAFALTDRMGLVCVGQSSRFKLPTLDMRGTPLGLDVRKAVELGITPSITTGILHASEGTGQVGAGIAEAPLACFTAALLDLDAAMCGQR